MNRQYELNKRSFKTDEDYPTPVTFQHARDWVRNSMHAYNELGHIPLFIHMPQGQDAGTQIHALTQNIDMMPTLCEHFGLEAPDRVKGSSLLPLIRGETGKQRDACIFGWYSKAVNVTDGRFAYLRAPQRMDNTPCYSYCAIPDTLNKFMGVPNVVRGKRGVGFTADGFEMGPFLKHTSYPVYKLPVANAEVFGGAVKPLKDDGGILLFDLKETDPDRHKQYTGAPLAPIVKNLRCLHDTGASILLRLPIIPGLNDHQEHFQAAAQLNRELPDLRALQLMPYHRMGNSKLERIGHTGDNRVEAIPPETAEIDAWIANFAELGVTLVNQPAQKEPRP